MDANELSHLEAIRVLKARYCRYMDVAVMSGKREDWDLLFDLFAEDAVFGGADAEPTELESQYKIGHIFGRQAIAERFLSMAPTASQTIHHVHTPDLTLTSASTATGIWMYEDLIYFKSGPIKSVQGFGLYNDTYVCEGGGWKIKSTMPIRWRIDTVMVEDGPTS